MKHTLFILLLIITLSITQACSSTNPTKNVHGDHSAAVATISDLPVTLNELRAGYTGNIDSTNVSTKQLREFLPSYVNYRLKVLEGNRLGYFDDPDILAEYRTFAKESAERYWINNEIEAQILDTFISRSKKELLAYHILVTAQNPEYEQSKQIKQGLLKAKEELLEGADPDSVNIKYSSSQNGNYAGGALPWITAGRTVKPFEDVLYSLEIGEVSDPFQTEFGFHIIYLMDERPRTPERLVSHIFVGKQGNDNADQIINQALDSLNNGTQWSDVVAEFSDDSRSADRSGEIGWVGYGMQFPVDFVDETMAVPANTDFSDIIEMEYGFHIVKIDSVRDFSSSKRLESYAKSELQRLDLLQPGKAELYEILADYGNFQLFEEEFDSVANYLLGTADSIDTDTPIAEFNDSPITSGQFAEFFNQEMNHSDEQELSISNAFEQFKERIFESNLIELTKERFDDYRFEMNKFLNGLVVYKVNEEFLWNPDAADEQLMLTHFEENRSEYNTEETINYYRITASADSIISPVRDSLLKDGDPEMIKQLFDNVIVRNGSTTKRNQELFKKLNALEAKSVTEIEGNNRWFHFYYVSSVEPKRPMTFTEAKSDIFDEIRDQHEYNYLQMLRNKYKTELIPENVQ